MEAKKVFEAIKRWFRNEEAEEEKEMEQFFEETKKEENGKT